MLEFPLEGGRACSENSVRLTKELTTSSTLVFFKKYQPPGEHLCCGNDSDGFDLLDQWLSTQECHPDNTIICTEDTGLYGKRLLVALSNAGWSVAVEKTTVLDKIGPSHHRKDDKFDAHLLAEYADRFSDQRQLAEPPEQPLERMSQLYSERRPPRPSARKPLPSRSAPICLRRAGPSSWPCSTGTLRH